MDIIGKLVSEAEQVEVVDIKEETTTVEFESNRLKTSLIEETKGTAVRVIKNDRLGFSASSDENAEDKLIKNVLESAKYGNDVPINFPGKAPILDVENYDDRIVNLPIPKMVEMGQEIIDTLLSFDPELQVNVSITRGAREFAIKNQTGLDLVDKKSPFSISFELARVHGDDILIIFDIMGNTIWNDDYKKSIKNVGELLSKAKVSGEIQSGRMPVLFSPKGALALVFPLMNGLNGKMVYTGISPMKDRIGERLFDSKLTVLDDPTVNGRFNSAGFDDEGVATKRNVLISNGEVKSFFYDLITAARSGFEPTGNGSRGLFNPPAPSISNFIVEPGDTSLSEMISGIDEGLWVEDVMGLGQGNIVSGAFSNTLSLAYKIEKGEITGRVKDVSIAGNIYNLLPNISAISQENTWVYNSFSLPYILMEDMNVVAKE
jgi:PmbA protein